MKAKEIGDKLVLIWEKGDEIKIGETITIELKHTYSEGYSAGIMNRPPMLRPSTKLELFFGKISYWIYLHLTKRGRQHHKKLKDGWKLSPPTMVKS